MKQTKMEVGTCHQVIRSEVELGDGGGGGVDHVASHPLSVMQKMKKKKAEKDWLFWQIEANLWTATSL